MKRNNGRVLSKIICLFTVLTFSSSMLAGSAFADSEGTAQAVPGEVLNTAEQGTTGTYEVTASGYYVINLRGADGGDGQDVQIESDGIGSYNTAKGKATADGGAGADGGSVSTLVYLKKGQILSYSIGTDGINYVERAERWEDLQRGCIHVYPNSNPIYKPEEYIDAGFGGGGGEGTWAALDGEVVAGAAGGGGGGGSVAACANWGNLLDPSGFKSKGADGGDATAVSTVISEEFTSTDDFNGTDGEKSVGRSETTGEYYAAALGHPEAPKFELVEFEAGDGGASGTSYINKSEGLYYGGNIPSEVSGASEYKNAAKPAASGIVITFVYAAELPIKIEFTDSTTGDSGETTVNPGETVEIEIPKPSTIWGYFKGWFNKKNSDDTLTRDYYGENTVELSYDDYCSSEYVAEYYDTSTMGLENVSDAKAQAVVISDGNGGEQKAIRFLAAIDSGYINYQKAGFIISKENQTPTIEAGYQYSLQGRLYKSILAQSPQTGKSEYIYANTAEMKELFGFDGVGLIYTNLKIADGMEDTVYYATPYIINAQGEFVYGHAKAVSYNQLKSYDTAVTGN